MKETYNRSTVNSCIVERKLMSVQKNLNLWAMEDHPKQVLVLVHNKPLFTVTKSRYEFFQTRRVWYTQKFSIASHVVVYVYINVYIIINQSVLWEKREGKKNNVGRDLQTRKAMSLYSRKKRRKKGFTILPKVCVNQPVSS